MTAITPKTAVGVYSVRPGRETATREFAGPGRGASLGVQRRETARMPACVEELGLVTALMLDGGVSAALKPRRRPDASNTVAAAPLDSREAYVLSLLDGELSVQSLVDITAIPRAELAAILDRLVGLGLVTLRP